jgi:hypothetical protein
MKTPASRFQKSSATSVDRDQRPAGGPHFADFYSGNAGILERVQQPAGAVVGNRN